MEKIKDRPIQMDSLLTKLLNKEITPQKFVNNLLGINQKDEQLTMWWQK